MGHPQHVAAFMFQDPVGGLFFPQVSQAFPEHQLLGLDETGAVVARINSVPFVWSGTDDDLPARGWDAVLERAFADRDRGARPTAVSLLEARVAPAQQGSEPGTPMERYAARTRSDGLPSDAWLRVHVRLGGRLVKVCRCR